MNRIVLVLAAGITASLPPATAAAAVELPASLYRALSTSAQPEQAAGLRRQLRGLLLTPATAAASRPAWDTECEQDRADSAAAPGVSRQRLPDGSWLLRVECSAGAYQGSFWAAQLWQQDGRGHAALLRWPVASPASPDAATGAAAAPYTLSNDVVLWGDVRVLASGRVEVVNRFRGIGDCGTRSLYALQRGAVRIATLAAVLTCPDTAATVPVGPTDWPVLKSFDH